MKWKTNNSQSIIYKSQIDRQLIANIIDDYSEFSISQLLYQRNRIY